jgi:hypothetical protein
LIHFRQLRRYSCTLAAVLIVWAQGAAMAENIDPAADGSQYAWGESIGWLNAEPQGDGGPGLAVSDSELTGWVWGENIGWISLSCQNTSSCGDNSYGVVNDGKGNLSGFNARVQRLGLRLGHLSPGSVLLQQQLGLDLRQLGVGRAGLLSRLRGRSVRRADPRFHRRVLGLCVVRERGLDQLRVGSRAAVVPDRDGLELS